MREVTPWKASGWTRTTRIRAELEDGTPREYFMKTCSEDFGALMMEGEFNSLKYVHTYIPKSCPEPFGWGEVSSSQLLTATPNVSIKPLLNFGPK